MSVVVLHEDIGTFVVADANGDPIWTGEHTNIFERRRKELKVATLLVPGTLWAWGETLGEAQWKIRQQAEKIKSLPLPRDGG